MNTLFAELDTHQDGYVTLENAIHVLRGRALKDAEIEDLLRSYDCHGDGVLQYEEFLKFWNIVHEV